MVLLELFFAFLFALVFSAVLTRGYGWRHPARPDAGPAGLFLFLILFLAIWAGGVWLAPFGPMVWGVAYIPFLIVAIVVTLLLIAAAPPRRPKSSEEVVKEAEEAATAGLVFGLFFWILLIALAAAVILKYIL